jgi:hypothetical protein
MAKYIEEHDPRSSVTLLLAACSGARAEHLWKNDFAGAVPGGLLPPQITQVKERIGHRKVDATIMSIGINNVWFGPLMEFCVESDVLRLPCEQLGVTQTIDSRGDGSYHFSPGSLTTLATETQTKVSNLEDDYVPLARHLIPLHAAHVFITEYPDPTHDINGNVCAAGVGPSFPRYYASTWQWLGQTGQALNAQVDHTSSYGWTPITGIPQDFTTHGYCSTTSYFRPLVEAHRMGNDTGAFHANFNGQGRTLAHTKPAVCSALYGNPTCDGIGPAR